MVELKAASPCEGLLPLSIAGVTLNEVDLGVMTLLSPLGGTADLAAGLEDAHQLTLPKPGRATGKTGMRCIWFGREEYLLAGPAPGGALAESAALVDQSDGWACVQLSGAGAVNVLARLVPVDLRDGVFKRGHTLRTLVQHMPASITRIGPDGFLILVFRSMAQTLVHDVKVALEGVAARG